MGRRFVVCAVALAGLAVLLVVELAGATPSPTVRKPFHGRFSLGPPDEPFHGKFIWKNNPDCVRGRSIRMINADTRAVIVRTSVQREKNGIGIWSRERAFFLGNAYAEAVRENGCPYVRSPVRYWGPHRADLAISKVAIGNDGGHSAQYTVTVTNLGPDPADGVVVTDDPETTFVATGSDPRCGPNGGAVFTCAIGALTAGSSTSLLVKTDCMVPSVNSASVASTTYDPNAANNSINGVASGPCPA